MSADRWRGRRRAVVSLLALGLLMGCGTTLHWRKQGATAQEFAQDSYDCAQQAQRPARGRIVVGPPLAHMLADEDDMSKDLYRACLQARGYQRVEGGDFVGIRD